LVDGLRYLGDEGVDCPVPWGKLSRVFRKLFELSLMGLRHFVEQKGDPDISLAPHRKWEFHRMEEPSKSFRCEIYR